MCGARALGRRGGRRGALGDAAELVRWGLQVEVAARPTAEVLLDLRFLNGRGGWGAA